MESRYISDAAGKTQPQKLLTRSFIFACISYGIYQTAHTMGYTVIPLILDSMNASGTVIGLMTTLNVIAGMVFRPALGRLSDQSSKVMLCFLGILAVMFCYLGIAIGAALSSILFLILFRTLHGIGAAASSTAFYAIVAEVAPRERQVDAFGYFGIFAAILGGFAPGIALRLVDGGTFLRGVLSIAGLAGVAMIAVKLVSYEKESWFRNRKTEAGTNTVTKGKGIASYLEKTAIPPTVIIFLIYFSASSSNSFLVLYAEDNGFQDIGLYYMIAAAGTVAFRFFVWSVRKKVSDRMILFSGMVMTVINYAAISAMNSYLLFTASGLLNGLGSAMYSVVLESAALKNAPPERVGVASSTLLLGIDMGFLAGSAVWGLISDLYGYRTVFLCATVILAIGSVASLSVIRKETDS